MNFFANITAIQIFGLALLLAGALTTFLSSRIASRMRAKNANLVVKCVGLAVVVVGFILIMFV